MTTATLTREKKKRGLFSLVSQFASTSIATQPEELALAPEKLAESSVPRLNDKLNRMIEAGASFDVDANSFQIFGAGNTSEADKRFLKVNEPRILCVLQQSLLMKYLSPDSVSDYAVEVDERLAILSDGGDALPDDLYFETVRSISKEWFIRLLDNVRSTASTHLN